MKTNAYIMYYYTIEQYMEYKVIGYNGIEIEVQLNLMKAGKVDCFRLFLLFSWHVFSILVTRPSTSSVPARDCV